MKQHGFIMPQHEEHPILKSKSNMPRHALTMPRHAKVGLIVEFEVMLQHDFIMSRHKGHSIQKFESNIPQHDPFVSRHARRSNC